MIVAGFPALLQAIDIPDTPTVIEGVTAKEVRAAGCLYQISDMPIGMTWAFQHDQPETAPGDNITVDICLMDRNRRRQHPVMGTLIIEMPAISRVIPISGDLRKPWMLRLGDTNTHVQIWGTEDTTRLISMMVGKADLNDLFYPERAQGLPNVTDAIVDKQGPMPLAKNAYVDSAVMYIELGS
jgi:hypothetical protein